MGDRANIVIRSDWPEDLGEKEAVFLHSHWGGHELPETLRLGLLRAKGEEGNWSRDNRWGDETYLARLVFQEMIGDNDENTGYGISTRLTDHEYDLLVLFEQRVFVLSVNDYELNGFDSIRDARSISFADYVEMERTWENLTEVVAGDRA